MGKFERLAVLGAGSMGLLLGAALARAGRTVELIDADPVLTARLRAQGARVTGTVEWQVPVTAVLPEEMTGCYDLVFLLVKQPHTETALASLLPHLHRESVVCTLQNGLPEPAVARAVGERRTMGCAVTWSATLEEPGVTRATAPLESWHSILGRPDGREEGTQEVREVLSVLCPAAVTANLTGVRWSKLLVNSALSGTSAALGCTFGEILAHPEALRCMQYLARECLWASRAAGVELEPLGPDEDFSVWADFSGEEERLARSALWFRLLGGPSNPGKSSMLQDLERGRPCEVEGINGVIQAAGLAAGVPTPWCDRVVELIQAAGRGGPLSLDNAALLRDLPTE